MKLDTRNPIVIGMAAVGMFLLLASAVFHFAVKPPDVKTAMAALKKQEDKSAKDIKSNSDATSAEVQQIQARLWSDPDDQIAPEALRRVTKLAQKHGIKMTAFRPQKEVVAGALNILPFFVSVDGAFPAVFDFVKEMEEDPSLLLIVNLVQLSSSDQTTHNVTASLGISAYLDPKRGTVATVKTTDQKPASGSSIPSTKAPATDASHTTAPKMGGKA